MPNYETVYILKPTLSNEKVEEVLEKVKGIITSGNGTIILSDSWGKRRLAYPVKKNKEGTYYLLQFSADGKVVGVLENFFRTTDDVIKYITLKIEKSFKKKTEPKKEEKHPVDMNHKDVPQAGQSSNTEKKENPTGFTG